MKASYLLEAKYVCVHAKKGKYECEAESSYGAAKKAAEHWGLKSTAGIDAHLADKPKTATEGIEGMTPNTQVRGIMPKQRKPYHKHKIKSDYEPETDLSEEDNPLPKNFFRMIATSDDPHGEIEGLMNAKGPAGDYIRRDYEITAGENGLHPDDDMEEIIDMMVQNYEDRRFEGMKNNKSMLGEVVKELTEEEFDEAAGKKDACYRKVKSRYKVWPSAYASGALVQCRKVGAANWGNKSKK